MKLSEFDFELPEELIAQHPVEKRDTSRLMVVNRENGNIEHRHFYDILDYLKPVLRFWGQTALHGSLQSTPSPLQNSMVLCNNALNVTHLKHQPHTRYAQKDLSLHLFYHKDILVHPNAHGVPSQWSLQFEVRYAVSF